MTDSFSMSVLPVLDYTTYKKVYNLSALQKKSHSSSFPESSKPFTASSQSDFAFHSGNTSKRHTRTGTAHKISRYQQASQPTHSGIACWTTSATKVKTDP